MTRGERGEARRKEPMRSVVVLSGAVALFALVALATSPVLGALPFVHGGSLRFDAPSFVRTLDPAGADDPFEAALAASIADGLYRDENGAVVPELAAGPPTLVDGAHLVRVRTEVVRHGGSALSARSVLTALVAASREPRARAFLEAFADPRGRLQIELVDDQTLAFRAAHPNIDVARVLATAPLAIVTGRDRTRHPIGTGPFSARLDATGAVTLNDFRASQRGAPFLAEIRIAPPRGRAAALRAFELAESDASVHGESLYGGSASRASDGGEVDTRALVLLVPNRRSGPLADDGLFGAVARAIDRPRLARTGLVPSDRLDVSLAPPVLPAARRQRSPPTLRIAIEAGDAFRERAADALLAMLDEAGLPARVTAVSADRYPAVVRSSAFDLRLAYVVPPLGDARGLTVAALVETGQTDEARALALAGELFAPEAESRAATRLDALVLGRLRASFHARSDLLGRIFTGGPLPALESLHYAREL